MDIVDFIFCHQLTFSKGYQIKDDWIPILHLYCCSTLHHYSTQLLCKKESMINEINHVRQSLCLEEILDFTN